MIRNKHKKLQSQTATKKLYKGNEKLFAGVCSGIAHYDVVVARVTCIVLFICTAGLITIPYLVLAVKLPESGDEDRMLEVNPVSVVSDKYQEVVQVSKETASRTSEQPYGVHADAGHVPPTPPKSGGFSVPSRAVYIAYRHNEEPRQSESIRTQRVALVVAVAAAMTVLFVVIANSIIARHSDLSLVDFWPCLFIVAGTTLLVCFYDRLSFAVRLSALLFCVELCFAFIPFTLGVCPPHALSRLSMLPFVLLCVSCVCAGYALARKKSEFYLIAVAVLGVALFCGMTEIGIFERLIAAQSYSRHNFTSPLFRQ